MTRQPIDDRGALRMLVLQWLLISNPYHADRCSAYRALPAPTELKTATDFRDEPTYNRPIPAKARLRMSF